MPIRPVVRPDKSKPAITLELSEELNALLVEKFALYFGKSLEETAIFLLEQASVAPEPAMSWMRAMAAAKWRNGQQPKTANAFEAYAKTECDRVLLENAAALTFAANVATFIKHATKAEPRNPAAYEEHGRVV